MAKTLKDLNDEELKEKGQEWIKDRNGRIIVIERGAMIMEIDASDDYDYCMKYYIAKCIERDPIIVAMKEYLNEKYKSIFEQKFSELTS
jgi:hypothetical protein